MKCSEINSNSVKIPTIYTWKLWLEQISILFSREKYLCKLEAPESHWSWFWMGRLLWSAAVDVSISLALSFPRRAVLLISLINYYPRTGKTWNWHCDISERRASFCASVSSQFRHGAHKIVELTQIYQPMYIKVVLAGNTQKLLCDLSPILRTLLIGNFLEGHCRRREIKQ